MGVHSSPAGRAAWGLSQPGWSREGRGGDLLSCSFSFLPVTAQKRAQLSGLGSSNHLSQSCDMPHWDQSSAQTLLTAVICSGPWKFFLGFFFSFL